MSLLLTNAGSKSKIKTLIQRSLMIITDNEHREIKLQRFYGLLWDKYGHFVVGTSNQLFIGGS